MESLKDAIMTRDGLTESEADAQIAEAKEMMYELLAEGDTEGAYEICSDQFGLEPDYLMDLLE